MIKNREIITTKYNIDCQRLPPLNYAGVDTEIAFVAILGLVGKSLIKKAISIMVISRMVACMLLANAINASLAWEIFLLNDNLLG